MEATPPIAAARMEGTVELSDGRSIGVAEYGDPKGEVIFWFHPPPERGRRGP
jgi:hypothetical protein